MKRVESAGNEIPMILGTVSPPSRSMEEAELNTVIRLLTATIMPKEE